MEHHTVFYSYQDVALTCFECLNKKHCRQVAIVYPIKAKGLVTDSNENVEIDIKLGGPISRYHRVSSNLIKPDLHSPRRA